jgi:WD40 repeat protein
LEVWRLVLLPDQRTLVSGGKDGAVCVWDTARVRHEQSHVALRIRAMSWSFAPDSKSVLTSDALGECRRWEGPNFQKNVLLAEVGMGAASCFGDDGLWLAAGSADGNIQIWDLQSGKAAGRFLVAQGKVVPQRLFAGGGRLIVYCDRDHSVHEWDVAKQREIQAWQVPERPTAFASSTDGRWFLTLGWTGVGSLRDAAAQQELAPEVRFPEAFGAAFSPDGRFVAAASSFGFANVWNATAWNKPGPGTSPVTLRGFLMGAHSVAFSPDNRRVAVGGDGREAMKLWDQQTGQELLTLEAQDSLFGHYGGTAFSPDGNILGSLAFGGVLHLWLAPSLAEADGGGPSDSK